MNRKGGPVLTFQINYKEAGGSGGFDAHIDATHVPAPTG